VGASVSVTKVTVDLELVLDKGIIVEGCDTGGVSTNPVAPRLEDGSTEG
jgi:hypothetical protein